ncbi:acyl-CoA thioesterase [Halomarina litorea]|uniref:acyl-CoA thioesterase n=1 Tax=Halomarina litorea TaxID=2961595 RepID=UPI0020C347AB|nr:thioesterase family protein [Halomarina sp. BCD28]
MDDPFVTTIQVRFKDIDAMDHVNSAVYFTYLEQARAAFYDEVIGERLDHVDTVIVSQELTYHAPVELGAEVRVELTIDGMGESSLPMSYEVYGDGELAATGESVQVAYDREAGTSTPIPEVWRERIESY